jgi:hypothetical protein
MSKERLLLQWKGRIVAMPAVPAGATMLDND